MEKSLQRYLRWYRSVNHSPKTVIFHDEYLRLFIRFCRVRDYSLDVDDLNVDTVRGRINDMRERGNSPHAVASQVRSIKAWTNWLFEG